MSDADAPERDDSNAGEQSLARLPFDRRALRVIARTARWMGALGRFQILAGGTLLLLCVGGSAAWVFGSSRAAPEESSETTPPLVQLGEVDPYGLGLGVAALVLAGALAVVAGVGLTDSAEDLERLGEAAADDETPYLEDGLRALGKAMWLDAALVAMAVSALVWLEGVP